MPEFPPNPLAPAEFLERWLPEAFHEAEVPEELRAADVKLGVRLDGQGGGEWVMHLASGTLRVAATSRAETAFTVVQTVEDWRGALWEGRGGAVGQGAAGLFRPGGARDARAAAGLGAAPNLATLEALRALDGLILVVVTGGEGGDWSVGARLGPGPIPEQPTTTISVSAADAAAMASGELNPLEAFMAGRIRVAGDVALMMQMQAIQMQAAAAAAAKG